MPERNPAPDGAQHLAESPVIDGWFTEGPEPALIGSQCMSCERVFFPPVSGFCRNPICSSSEWSTVELSRRGRVWSYTDAQYQPPPPYISPAGPYEPFAIAAVELPEGITILGQVATGYGVQDLTVGAEVELVIEPHSIDEAGVRTVWRWRPTQGLR